MVVMLVSITGRNRRQPASRSATRSGCPSRTRRLMKSMRQIESLTTTPARATSPNMLKSVSGIPMIAWPNTAPAMPNGIAARIRNGWKYDLNSIVSSTNMANRATTKPTPRLSSDSFVCSCCPSQRTRMSGNSAASVGISRFSMSLVICELVSELLAASMSAVTVIDRFCPRRLISEKPRCTLTSASSPIGRCTPSGPVTRMSSSVARVRRSSCGYRTMSFTS